MKIMPHLGILAVFALMDISTVFCDGQTARFPSDLAAVPEIECSPEAIIVRLNATAGVASKIFVRGHHDEANCSYEHTNTARFQLQDCGIVRQRQLKPKGLAVTSTFVVQLHPLFITKLDRAYKVRCFYLEADRTMTSSLEVSTISAKTIEQETPLPQCHYQLRSDQPDGPEVRYARIGDRVWHIWKCDSSETYGMLVHSCNVHDGKGNQIQIIDENGCALDDFIIETPIYNDTANVAMQETMVFKFADVLAVQFHCQIKLCLRSDGGCFGVTPPECTGKHNRSLQLVHSDAVLDDRAVENDTVVPQNLESELHAADDATVEDSSNSSTVVLKDFVSSSNDSVEVLKDSESEFIVADGMLRGNLSDGNSTEPFEENNEAMDGSGAGTAVTVEQVIEDLMNDTRSRRNVYSEPWFTAMPTSNTPSGLETDVSQEILVLDVGDAAASLTEEEQSTPVHLSLMENAERTRDSYKKVCVTSGTLAAAVSGFVLIIMLLTLAIFLLVIKRHQVRVRLTNDYPDHRACKL